VYSAGALFLDAREAGGLLWNDARGPIKGKPSDVINETMISPGQENIAVTLALKDLSHARKQIK
jgi:hypothetical protein